MRTYGRIPDPMNPGKQKWVQVTTDANGNDDLVWLTTLIQCLKLNLNESPFYAQYGIPAQQSIIMQIAPDLQVAITQQQFSSHFASLVIARVDGAQQPTYRVNVLTNTGVRINREIGVPT